MRIALYIYAYRKDIPERIRTAWRRFRWCLVRLLLTEDERSMLHHDLCEIEEREQRMKIMTRDHAIYMQVGWAEYLRGTAIERLS